MKLADLVALMFWRPRQAAVEARQTVITEEVASASRRIRAAVDKHNRAASALIEGALHHGADPNETRH